MSFGQYSNESKPAKPAFPEKTKRLKYVFDDPTHVWAHPLKVTYRYSDANTHTDCVTLAEAQKFKKLQNGGTIEEQTAGFEQDNARNQNANIYFKTSADGTRVLYSYRDSYPIASLFTHKKQTVVLLRSGKPYSVTTAKHFNMARNASRHIETRFSVPEVNGYQGKPEPDDHSRNLADYVARINSEIEAFGKARSSSNIETRHAMAINLDHEARAYAKFFGLKLPKLPKLPVLDAEKMRVLKERESAADAKRNAVKQAERAERDRIHALNNAERIAEWRAGKPVDRWLISQGAYALLRVKLDDKTGLHNVETSQGVNVPVTGRAGAARLLEFLRACRDNNRPYKANGHTEHIGQFTVQSFAPTVATSTPDDPTKFDWVLVAGCHRILWSEIESIADAVRTANDADIATPNNAE